MSTKSEVDTNNWSDVDKAADRLVQHLVDCCYSHKVQDLLDFLIRNRLSEVVLREAAHRHGVKRAAEAEELARRRAAEPSTCSECGSSGHSYCARD